jgi:hypothetical protein
MKWIVVLLLLFSLVYANEPDWDSANSWDERSDILEEETNILFEKAKIENRSKRMYRDKVYKYITGDYEVENNTIELSTVRLSDRLENEDIDVNVYTDNLDIEGNEYKDGMDLRRNRYKNFVHNDDASRFEFNEFDEGELNQDFDNEPIASFGEEFLGEPSFENSRYTKVIDEDISEIEELDLREADDLREVNVLIEDVNIFVD